MELAIARLEQILEEELKIESKYRNEVDWAVESYNRSLKTLEIQQDYVDELNKAIARLKYDL